MLFKDNRYTLYNKNNKILDFHCERNAMDEPVFITDTQFSDTLPYNFREPGYWIGNRRAPSHREHIKEILTKCGCNDLEGFIRFTYGASLNDTFWIKPYDSELSWEDISLYRNYFDENIAKIAFDGGLMGEKMSSPTPELITDGTVAKCWKRFEDDIYLLKRGTKLSRDEDIYGYGPFSEKYTYELAKHICENPLKYDVMRYHGKTASKCKLFCDENTSYAPIAYVLGERARLSDCIEYFDSIGYGEQFREMIVLDSLTFNEDRHLKNFGILYDADTMRVKEMAPVFDNNLALFPNNPTKQMHDKESFLESRVSAFGMGFDEIAKKCMTPKIQSELINLKGFEFPKGEKLALDDERLDALSDIVNSQIDVVLGRKTYAIENKNKELFIDDIMLTFDEENIPKEARNMLTDGDFIIPEFDIITASDNTLHVSDCRYDVNTYDGNIEVDIYETKFEGKSESLDVKELKDFKIVSPDLTKEIMLKISEIGFQMRHGEKVRQSCLDDFEISASNDSKSIERNFKTTAEKDNKEAEKIIKNIMNKAENIGYSASTDKDIQKW